MIANLTRGAKSASIHLPAERRQIAGVLSYLGADHITEYSLPSVGQDATGILVSLEPIGIAERNIVELCRNDGISLGRLNAGFHQLLSLPYDEDRNAFADLPASCCHLLGAPDSPDFPDSVLDTVAKLYEKPFSMDTLLEEGSYSAPDPDDWVLLAQFPSFSDGVDFGCMGLIDFCIRKDDLQKKDFARARMLLQNCEQ